MATFLGIDILTIARLDITLQTVAYALLLTGFYFAFVKKDYTRHKKLMTSATLIAVALLVVVMLPAFLSVLSQPSAGGFMPTALLDVIIVHHGIGLVTIALAVITTLYSCDWANAFVDKKIYMLTLFSLWTLTYLLGIYIYFVLYGGL